MRESVPARVRESAGESERESERVSEERELFKFNIYFAMFNFIYFAGLVY